VITLGPGQYAFGSIVGKETLARYCDNKDIRPSLTGIRKIIPNIAGAHGTEIQYWTEADNTLQQTTCPQVSPPSGGELRLEDGTVVGRITEISDITLAAM
jgi:hypothetical protein